MSHAQQISEIIDGKRELFTSLSDQVWEQPELRFEEYKSAEILAQALEQEGFRVERGVCGLETAFIASYGEGGPVIGFLGEYDALPGLSQKAGLAEHDPIEEDGPGHGCGHNLLGVGALAAAVAARDYLIKHNLPGTIRFYGCPAEEGGGGKVIMVEKGAFKDVDASITWHPSTAHYVRVSRNLATFTSDFHFHGKSAHAAASPHFGRSALDAVELMNIGANFLREHIPQEFRLHYAITETGGRAPNVVQAKASVRYQLRAPESSMIDEVYPRLLDIAKGAALMTGTEFEVVPGARYKNHVPNDPLQETMHSNFEQLGLPDYTEEERSYAREIRKTFPEDQLKSSQIPEVEGLVLAEKMPPYRSEMKFHYASSDVGDVSWVVPTVEFRGATWVMGTAAHTWQAVAQGKSSYAHKGMLLAGKVMGATGINLLLNPEIIQKAKADHQRRIS